jgi:hypothetical protein
VTARLSEDKRTEHEKEVDALIPLAEKMANEKEPVRNSAHWGMVFMEEMNVLAVERGLRVPIETILASRRGWSTTAIQVYSRRLEGGK